MSGAQRYPAPGFHAPMGFAKGSIQSIASENLSDLEWEEYWYRSPAYSFPKSAKASKHLVEMVIREIKARRERN